MSGDPRQRPARGRHSGLPARKWRVAPETVDVPGADMHLDGGDGFHEGEGPAHRLLDERLEKRLRVEVHQPALPELLDQSDEQVAFAGVRPDIAALGRAPPPAYATAPRRHPR